MDITKALADLKKEPDFADKVGMVLVHNGVVRGWSRTSTHTVTAVRVTPDRNRINEICHELSTRPGIFRILADAAEGDLAPGDDVLFLVVAGDIRENVKVVFAELLDRIKTEAVTKKELFG